MEDIQTATVGTASDASPLVEVRNVSKTYEPFPRAMRFLLRSPSKEPVVALDGVSLKLNRGETAVVVGPNGAGKSTLFRIITGLTTPTSGSASVAGLDSTSKSWQVRRHVGFAPAEERTLLLRHSCKENLEFHGAMQGMSGSHLENAIVETLGYVGLGDVAERAAIALSTGMRARLQLARALLHEPDVLVLDEPTSAIDPVGAREILELVLSAGRERGAAVLISSHRLEEIEALQERVLLLDRGRPVFAGDLSDFRAKWTSPMLETEFVSVAAARSAHSTFIDHDLTSHHAENSRQVTVEGMESPAEAIAILGDLADGLVGVSRRAPNLVEVLTRARVATDA